MPQHTHKPSGKVDKVVGFSENIILFRKTVIKPNNEELQEGPIVHWKMKEQLKFHADLDKKAETIFMWIVMPSELLPARNEI